MNSLMSMRTIWSSLSNRKPARALHSSVLPTPVGPRNRKLPSGRFGSDRPARERRIASLTAWMASSWPTTRSCSLPSICSSFSRSPCISLDTGMPVARATTSAISSAPTSVRSRRGLPESPALPASLAWASLSVFSSSGRRPYCSSATLLKSPLRLRSSICCLMRSISSLTWAEPWAWAFSAVQISSRSSYSRWSFCSSSSISAKRFCEPSSFSLRTASRSILSWIIRRSSRSIASGLESISILILAAASSIRSMALSGRKRSVM
mmetsp:Transcript_36630/g.85069  ORF Transcript_36630/g.85069 Transcript_36630/m.85069 type:complete len:265 (-) Transcript_36630:257-1051(-)